MRKLTLFLMALASGCSGSDGGASTLDGAADEDGGAVVVDSGGSSDGGTTSPDGATPLMDGQAPNMDAGPAPSYPDGSIVLLDGGAVILPDGAVLWIGDAGVGPTACTNGMDDDGDGLVDFLDPECTGNLDNDEGSFGTGIPGDNRDGAWQDCFFDGNSGHGDDGCMYPTECLYGMGEGDDCDVTQGCLDYCVAGTPNGCDCFGCCIVERQDGTTTHVILNATCSADEVDDPSQCTACVQSNDCVNPCGTCELCPGRTLADLPKECFEAPPVPDAGVPSMDGGTTGTDAGPPPIGFTCDNGEQVCGPGLPPCPAGDACNFGCCITILY